MSPLPVAGGVGGVGGAAAVIVSATDAVCVRAPELPVKMIVALPTAAPELAVTITCCGVPRTSISVEGETVTPEGAPLNETLTLPVNPETAVAVTVTDCPEAPAARLALVGVA